MNTKRDFICVVLMGLLLSLSLLGQGCSKGIPGASKYFPVKIDEYDRWGFVDIKGNLILDNEWKEKPSMETEGVCYVRGENGYEYFVLGKKPVKIGQQYTDASNFSEGLAAVIYGEDDKAEIQYIDKKGNIRLILHKIGGSKIVAASRFSEGLAWVKNDKEKYGYINKSGELVIPFIYDNAKPFNQGLAEITKKTDSDYISGFINKKGEEAIIFKSAFTYGRFSEGYCTYLIMDEEGVRSGVFDTKGNTLIRPSKKTVEIGEFRNGVAVLFDGDSFGLIDAKGREIVRPKYDEMEMYPHGFSVNSGIKMGVLDFKGKEIFPMAEGYGYVVPWSPGLFRAQQGEYYTLINAKGNAGKKTRFIDLDDSGLLGFKNAKESVDFSNLSLWDMNLFDGYGDFNDFDDFYFD